MKACRDERTREPSSHIVIAQASADPLRSGTFLRTCIAQTHTSSSPILAHNVVRDAKAAMTSEAQVQAEAEPSAPALPLSEPPATAPTAPATAGTPEQPLSKNAQKKLARAARIAEQKKERRAYEKEKKKEKRRQQAAKRAAGELDDGSADAGAAPRKKARVEGPRTPFDARIVVDLGFDDMMNENVSEFGVD